MGCPSSPGFIAHNVKNVAAETRFSHRQCADRKSESSDSEKIWTIRIFEDVSVRIYEILILGPASLLLNQLSSSVPLPLELPPSPRSQSRADLVCASLLESGTDRQCNAVMKHAHTKSMALSGTHCTSHPDLTMFQTKLRTFQAEILQNHLPHLC